MHRWWRRSVDRQLTRLREGGRAALLWSLRITVAATASYVVALLIFPGTQPLLAPLTAMLVVQVTPVSLLASGLDRVVAVVAGVSLAVAFSVVVPLHWWSLAVLLFVSLTIGQALRLRSNLIEVAISAMLVLGVGTLGAEDAAVAAAHRHAGRRRGRHRRQPAVPAQGRERRGRAGDRRSRRPRQRAAHPGRRRAH